MFSSIQNGTLHLQGDTMHYIRFGSGPKVLIMLPGLGDGLTTVKGTALPMALMYRAFSRDYTVHMFSRRNHLPQGYTTRNMARDLKEALDLLSIQKADLIGVSMGGMIAQHFAADYPEHTNKLVLVVTCAQPNPTLTASIGEWISLAERGDHQGLMDSNVRLMYTDTYYRKNKWLIPIMGKLTKPKSYDRFLIQANACLCHQSSDRLALIRCPALVIGGGQDHALGAQASYDIAAASPTAQLHMYPDLGHALYEEAGDFNQIVLDFLAKAQP